MPQCFFHGVGHASITDRKIHQVLTLSAPLNALMDRPPMLFLELSFWGANITPRYRLDKACAQHTRPLILFAILLWKCCTIRSSMTVHRAGEDLPNDGDCRLDIFRIIGIITKVAVSIKN